MKAHRRIPRLLAWAGLLALLAAVAPGPFTPIPPAAAAPPPELTFSATIRSSGLDAIFVANADGTGVRQITPNNGRSYSWGRFAYGNTKIVYTVRAGSESTAEGLGLMDVDGGNRRLLRQFEYRILQPVVDKTGRWVHYSAKSPFFPRIAQFRLDLRTDTVTNITALGSPKQGADADPNLTNTGKSLLFVRNPSGPGAAINRMDPDGTDRAALTKLTYHNTDPAPSADGRWIVMSSYRGYGKKSQRNPDIPSNSAMPEYYRITKQALRLNAPETVLTDGDDCTIRVVDKCIPKEMSAWVPRFTPNGKAISFTGALNYNTTCICVIDANGDTDGWSLIERTDLAIHWHTWPQPIGYSTSTAHIGTAAYSSRLLVVLVGPDKVRRLAISQPDLATRTYLTLPNKLQPTEARWGPGRQTIVFTANVKVGTRRAPHPAPPRGSKRKVHVVPKGARKTDAAVAQRQVFLLNRTTNKVTKLTDPWTEDWRDGLPSGDARGNYRPRISPDGRAVYVTNVSTRTGESFLLRIDLATRAVRNLTKPVTKVVRKDADPVLSQRGTRLVFTRSEGGQRDLFVMDSATGRNLTRLRNDPTSVAAPAWSPDNSYLLYTSSRKTGSVIARSRLTGTTKAARPTLASGGRRPASAGRVSPGGDRIVFLAPARGGTRIYFKSATGTATRLLQPDLAFDVLSVDWR